MKNRVVLSLLITLLVSLLFSPNAESQEAQETVVRVAPHSVYGKEDQTVDIVVENGQNVAGYQVVLQFDSASLTYVESQFQHGEYLPENAFFGTPKIIDIDPTDSLKMIRFAAVSYTGESNGNGILATLTFEKSGSFPLTLLGDIDGTLLSNKAGEVTFPRLEHSVTSPTTVRDLVVESVQAIPIDDQGIPTGDARHFYSKNEKLQLRITVKNLGNVSTGVQNLIVSRSNPKATDIWSELSDIEPEPKIVVAPNRSADVLLSDLVVPEETGTYYYRICVKATLWESEGKVDNNCSTIKIEVDPPDLVVTKVWTKPATVVTGGELELFAKVSHSGRKSDKTVLWHHFYGDQVDANTRSFEELRASRIVPLPMNDGTTEVTKEITVTAPKIPGTYYYAASVDSVDGEENTSNNYINPVTIIVQQSVNIPDSNLLRVIETELGKTPGDTITATDMQDIKDLNAKGKSIINLTGLELAINLETLDLSNNQISDVNPLAGLTKLKVLDISNNVVPLAGLKNLTLNFPHKITNAHGSTVYNYGDSGGNKTVLIKGLELAHWNPSASDYTTNGNNKPPRNGKYFKIYKQPNNHTCGHTSALMLSHYYGVKLLTLPQSKLKADNKDIELFDDLAKGSLSVECKDLTESAYPNGISKELLDSIQDLLDLPPISHLDLIKLGVGLLPGAPEDWILCIPGASDLVYKFAPGTLPHEMAIGA